MAEFAMKSLVTMINNNPTIHTNGSLPHLGSRLSVDWQFAGALSAWILAIQFAIFAVVVRTAQIVVVKDDTSLSTARLLRPLVNGLGDRGTLVRAKELSPNLQKRYRSGLVYGPRTVKGHVGYSLDIAEDILPLASWPAGKHPGGTYR